MWCQSIISQFVALRITKSCFFSNKQRESDFHSDFIGYILVVRTHWLHFTNFFHLLSVVILQTQNLTDINLAKIPILKTRLQGRGVWCWGMRLVVCGSHLIPFLWVLGELVMVHDASFILRWPIAYPHPSKLLRSLLGKSGAWWGHTCLPYSLL